MILMQNKKAKVDAPSAGTRTVESLLKTTTVTSFLAEAKKNGNRSVIILDHNKVPQIIRLAFPFLRSVKADKKPYGWPLLFL